MSNKTEPTEETTEPKLLETEVVTEKSIKIEKIKESKDNPAELAAKYLKVSKDGLSVTVEGDLGLEEFLPLLDFKLREQQGVAFHVGDMLLYAGSKWKERLTLVMAQTGRSMSTLEAYAVVAKAFPPSLRDPRLTWSAHQQLAVVANNAEIGGKQKAKELMAKAAKGDEGKPMSKREVKELVQAALPKKEPKPGAKKKGPKTKAAKAAKKDAKPTHRDFVAEEIAAVQDLRKRVAKELCSAIENAISVLSDKPGKEMTLLDAICAGTNTDKKAVTAALPDVKTLDKLRAMIQKVEDNTGY